MAEISSEIPKGRDVTLFVRVVSLSFAMLLAALTPCSAAAENEITLKFCYEDKQLLPYYAGNNASIGEAPGATIEHLRSATAAAGIRLQLYRMPWLRCLHELEQNSMDALVAAYDETRAAYTVYPKDSSGQPDDSLAINQLGLCLAHRYDNNITLKINQTAEPLTVARPLGYRPIPFPDNTLLVAAHSPEQALELVVEGRVDATTVLCQLNGINAAERHLDFLPVQLLYPPLYVSSGFLMLSQGFYQRYPQASEALWQALPLTLNKARYLHYLNYPLQ